MSISNEDYIDSLYPRDEQLERVLADIRERGMPEISVAPGYGKLLTMLVRAKGAKRILEIGALGGYSGICLARGLGADGTLTSLELEQRYADVARANLTEAGLGDKATYIVGDASAGLEKLIAAGKRFDFFFIDADKENYPRYLEAAMQLAEDGAIVAADNTLLRGRAADPEKNGPSVLAMREFNRRIAQDPALNGLILPSFDGLALAEIRRA